MAIEESEIIAPAERNRQETLTTTYEFVETLNDSIKHLLVAIFFIFLFIVFFAVFAARKIAGKFTQPLLTLSDGVREIAGGNFDKKIELHTGNEIEHLAVCFNAMTDENHLAVTIANVSGKGVPAALYMMRAKTALKNLVTMANNPDDFAAVMTLANQELCRENETMMFVTVFFA